METLNKNKKERNYLFDNIKAVLVFFVVSAHYIRVNGSFDPATAGGMYYIIAFSFIMQGFLLVSGYFSKNTEKCRSGAFKNFLMPYLILMPVMFCFRLILFDDVSFDMMHPSHALWYLLVMFVYRFFIKDLGKVRGIVVISALLMLVSGCFSSLGEELALGRICSFLVFFIIGYKMRPEHVEKIRRIPKPFIFVLLAALLVFSYFLAFSEAIPIEMWHLKDGYSIYHMSNAAGILIRFILGVTALAWLLVIFSLTPSKKMFLSDIGQRTLAVYVCHIPVRYAIKAFSIPGDGSVLTYVISFTAAAASVYVFSRPKVQEAYNSVIDLIYDIVEKVFRRAVEVMTAVKRNVKSLFKDEGCSSRDNK